MNPNGREDGRITQVCGSSGSGKTAYTVAQIINRDRVIVWDVEAQYCDLPGFTRISSRRELIETLRKTKGKGRFAFVPASLREFDYWARCAFAWAKLAPCAIVAEELADVTTPGKAPDGWGVLIRRVRKYGGDVFAITQRPSESDKTTIGNAHEIVCMRLSRYEDRAYMARAMSVDNWKIDQIEDLHFVKKNMRTGRDNYGKLAF